MSLGRRGTGQFLSMCAFSPASRRQATRAAVIASRVPDDRRGFVDGAGPPIVPAAGRVDTAGAAHPVAHG